MDVVVDGLRININPETHRIQVYTNAIHIVPLADDTSPNIGKLLQGVTLS